MNSSSLTILMLVTKRQYRGAEISAYNLSKTLVEKGHKVIWVGLYASSDGESLFLEDSANYDLPESKSWLSYQKLKKLASIYSKYKPAIVQANGSDTLRYVVLLKLLGFKSKIVYRNISIISKWVNTKTKYYFSWFLFHYTDKVISVGEASLNDFRSFFSFSETKSKMIRRGIPLVKSSFETIENIKYEYKIKNDDFVFIHIGNFSKEKNHVFLLEVWENLKSRHTNIKLVLLGEGLMQKEIKKLIQKKNLSESIILPGLQPNIADWLAISKIMLLCSTVEGVPGVVVESSFQGIPTIAVDVGGVKEVLIDGENGILVSHHDVDLFVQQIEKLIINNELLKAFSQNSRLIVQDRFDLEKNTLEFIKTYYSLL